jgi:hypothetical protein
MVRGGLLLEEEDGTGEKRREDFVEETRKRLLKEITAFCCSKLQRICDSDWRLSVSGKIRVCGDEEDEERERRLGFAEN